MVKVRFKVGDVIEVAKYWDQGDDRWQEGIVQIVAYEQPGEYAPTGVYHLKILKGSITWAAYNTKFMDELPYLIWMGNINEDKTLRLLYGK